jgi:hypothetical protein
MFQKLNLAPLDIDLTKIVGPSKWSSPVSIEYSISDSAYLRDIITKKIKFNILPYEVHVLSIPGDLPPHLDTCKTKLNYYLEVNNESTFFYEWKDKSIEDSSVLKIFPMEQLNLTSTFTAQAGDWYLINTHVPHNTSFANKDPRLLLCFCFSEAFDQVLDSIHLL